MTLFKIIGFAGLTALAAGTAVWLWPSQEAQAETHVPAVQAPLVEITLPAELSANAQIGQRIFDENCAACHGENATGRNGSGPPLVHRIYEPGHHADEAFQRAVSLGARSHHWAFGDMPPVGDLGRADVVYVIAFVRELQRENGIN